MKSKQRSNPWGPPWRVEARELRRSEDRVAPRRVDDCRLPGRCGSRMSRGVLRLRARARLDENTNKTKEIGARPEYEYEYVLPVPHSTGQFVVRLCDYEVHSATLRKSRPAFHCWFHTGTVARGRSMPKHFTPHLERMRGRPEHQIDSPHPRIFEAKRMLNNYKPLR